MSDAAERERIRTSLDESLIVEAAAGTGKTTELVRRLVNVIAEGRGTVERIAALTFTEKAAGELKLRLRAELEDERRAAKPGTARHGCLDKAIAQLEEARISTIHGFCKDLLQERPVEACVDPRFKILDETEAQALYHEAFDRWLERVLEDPPEGVRRVLRRGSRRRSDESPTDRLREAGWTLASWRDLRTPWRRPRLEREATIDRLIERVHGVAALLTACSNRGDAFYRKTWRLRRLSDDVTLAEGVQTRDHDALEAALVELAEDRDFRDPGTGTARNYREPGLLERTLSSHGELAAMLDDFVRLANADLAALLHAELGETIAGYERLKARAGRLDFFDLLVRMRDLVRQRPEVRAELQGRFSHVFVDEFQDTDPLQAEILLLLTAADPTIDRWRDVVPVPGKLFIVGDPKQSIYRFRRADVGVYQDVKKLLSGRGVACLQLRTSFRAVPSLQHLVNTAFAPVMTEDRSTLQAGYVALDRHRAEIGGQPSIVALPVPKPYGATGLTKTAIVESLPGAVAAFVHWLVSESGWKVTVRDQPGKTQAISSRHVCLLFRRFSSFNEDVTRPFVEALEARGVPHVLVGSKSFHVREEVESLRTALTAVEWPDDELSVYAVLKGSLFAIGDDELLEYRQRFHRLHPYRVPKADDLAAAAPEHLAPVIEALSLLRELHARRNARPVEETVRVLIAATRAHAGLVLRPWGEQALANVMRLAELARAYEVGGGISFRGFVERLREEADGQAPEAPIVEDASEGVRLMTVHRAKGLEFPVVILADVTANIAPERPARHVDAERGLCAVALGRWAPLDLLDHEAEEIARERAEGVRVAYVAATRARDLLVVPSLGDDPREAGWGLADDAWAAPVQRAMHPEPRRRRLSTPAPGCPEFGEDSVLVRPDRDKPGADNVRPGQHVLGSGDEPYEVVWWDPSRLALDVTPLRGLRRRELLEDAGRPVVDADRKRHDEWLADRTATLARGARPTIPVELVTERATRMADPSTPPIPVDIIDAAPAERPGFAGARSAGGMGGPSRPPISTDRPAGIRFGTLVHAILATVALDATPEAVADVARLQTRVLAATPAEEAAAVAAVVAVLAHPLIDRARAAAARGRCRRETPVAGVDEDGVLVEGILDLAFEDEEGWTVVDFKTSGEAAASLPRYRRQVSLYATLVGRATGRDVRATLLRI